MHKFKIQQNKSSVNRNPFPVTLQYQPQDTLRVIEKIELTSSTYILRCSRRGIKFNSGQHISLGIGDKGQTREYSIYSGANENFIEVLIKEVDDGLVSKQLKKVDIGTNIRFSGPVGYFQLNEDELDNTKYLFIASGTGIAPFHSFIKTFPDINYHLIHSVRYGFEAYEKNDYQRNRFTLCTSRDDKGDYFGRVTEYLKENPISSDTQVYLCGNCDMIHDAYDILLDQGIPSDNLHSEVYF